MVQEQWQQVEMKFCISLWHENYYLEVELTYGEGSLLGVLEFFEVEGRGEQIFG